MGQLAACLGKKVNGIIIFLILFDHMLFPLSLVSFRSWSQQQGKPFIFNQIDLTVKRRKTETERAGLGFRQIPVVGWKEKKGEGAT